MKRKLMSLVMALLLVVTLITPMKVAFAGSSGQVRGAIFTTDKNGDKVNENKYDKRKDVYLNGGPKNEQANEGLPDGDYYVQVTNPSGKIILGKSNETVVEVVYGEFTERYQLWDIVYSSLSGFNEKGFDFTSNHGDEYKVWIGKDYNYNKSKTDNFKVRECAEPKIAIEKTVEPTTAEVGEGVTYTFIVTNSGNVDLNDVEVEDPLLENLDDFNAEGSIGDLKAGESKTFHVEYTILQDDVKEDEVENTASAKGKYDNDEVGPATANATVEISTGGGGDDDDDDDPGIAIEKTVNPTTAKVGDSVTYTFIVTNSGNVDLNNVEVEDPLLENLDDFNAERSIGDLEVGKSKAFDVEYTILQDDVIGDQVVNNATAKGEYDDGEVEPATDSAIVEITTSGGDDDDDDAAITIEKTVEPTTAKVGDSVTYTFIVTNSGHMDLNHVEVEDPLLENLDDFKTDKIIGDLKVGESKKFDVEYTISQEDVIEDKVVNKATAKGQYDNEAVEPATASVTVEITTSGGGDDGDDDEPAIAIEKTVEPTTAKVGDGVTYTFIVTNSGDVDLNDVEVEDPLLENLDDFKTDKIIGDLKVGESKKFDVEYTISQGDVTEYKVVNTATAKGKYDNEAVEPATASATVEITTSGGGDDGDDDDPAIDIEKTVEPTTAKVGDRVTYTFIVTNSGDVDLNHVEVEDPLLENLDDFKTDKIIGDLKVGESKTFDVEYEILQDDVIGDEVVNIATAKGEYDDGEVEPATDSAIVEITTSGGGGDDDDDDDPAITIEKTVKPTTAKVGEEVTYTFVVKNTGDVSLSDVVVKDSLLAHVQEFIDESSIGYLKVGEFETFQIKYIISEEDVESDQVVNTAEVTGHHGSEIVRDKDDATVDITTSGSNGENGGENGDTTKENITPEPEEPEPEQPTEQPTEPEKRMPDLPYTGGPIEPEMILSGLGTLLVMTGVVLRRKKR